PTPPRNSDDSATPRCSTVICPAKKSDLCLRNGRRGQVVGYSVRAHGTRRGASYHNVVRRSASRAGSSRGRFIQAAFHTPRTPTSAAELEVSVVMPCLNEARTVGRCVAKAKACLERLGVAGEVVVADNGSTDGSQELARAEGAHVVPVARKGYGSALQGGIDAARGKFIIMCDADDAYEFSALDPFIDRLR